VGGVGVGVLVVGWAGTAHMRSTHC
jgi:hypothetical protein